MNEHRIDAATGTWIGGRERQEDACIAHVLPREETGLIVLSDGMGGHCDGDIASRAIVTEVLSDLFLAASRPDVLRLHGPAILRRALEAANGRVRSHSGESDGSGMGGTLISGVILDDTVRWISVGDSPLYLYRDGTLSRLNADHSFAPQIDMMLARGEIGPDEARDHPQRSILTSAITGGPISRVDCPDEPTKLRPGDVLLFASDGIATLDTSEIEALLRHREDAAPQQIVDGLIEAVEARSDHDQDNVSAVVVTVRAAAPETTEQTSYIGEQVHRMRRRMTRLTTGFSTGGVRP